MNVFWKHGFFGASLSQLLQATGLHKGSLYSAFKSKEDLFTDCLELYFSESKECFYKGDISAKEYITQFYSEKLGASALRRKNGCLLMNSCLELSSKSGGKNGKLAKKLLKKVQENLAVALQKGVDEGEFASDLNVNLFAERLLALAFTIEQLGQIHSDVTFLRNITNGVLKDIGIEV